MMLLFLFVSVCYVSAQMRQTAYDENFAKRLLNLAAGSYGKMQEQCVNQSYSQGVILNSQQLFCDKLNNTCGSFVAASDSTKELIVVFRGTKTDVQLILEGWSTLQPLMRFYGMGGVNSYFQNGHELLWPSVKEAITQPKYSGYSLIFTGHSLGAALACLAAARAAVENIRRGDQIKMVTFGEPRVGDLNFARSFDSIIPYSFRVVHRHDIVPHLPGCKKSVSLLDALRDDRSRPCDSTAIDRPYHHGIEIWYPDSMSPGSSYIECLGEPHNEDFNCSDLYKFNLDKRKDYIEDHRHYFDLQVPHYGEAGCNPNLPEGSPETNE